MSIHILNAGNILTSPQQAEIEKLVTDSVAKVSVDLKLKPLDVVVCDYPGLAIEEIGVGGYSPGPNLAFIAIEPGNPEFESWRESIPSIIAHELHHTRRWQGPGYGVTLLDSLVSEGLACLYEKEFSGRLPVYAQQTEFDVEALWREAFPLLQRKDLHAQWFFYGPHGRWAGYALGTELCRRFLSHHGSTAREMVHADAIQFPNIW